MVNRDDILNFCAEYLKISTFDDFCRNGLQVEGTQEIDKIVTGVSWSAGLVARAVELNAQMVMVHHGIFKGFFNSGFEKNPHLTGMARFRIKQLLQNDINLVGFHLPIDAHPEIGNNISLARGLALKNIKPFAPFNGIEMGFVGELENPVSLESFNNSVSKFLEADSRFVLANASGVKKVAVVSGAAGEYYSFAKTVGADTLLTGEVSEHCVHEAIDSGVNLIVAGHYNTEKLGIQNLGKLVADKFGIEVEFVDIPCEF